MIRSISDIKDISVIDQNLADNIYRVNTIDYEETTLGEGGFGSVHKVYSIDGKTVNNYVLKIISNEDFQDHSYNTIKLLHEKITKHQFSTKLPIYHEIPELLGLPFMVFYGQDMIEDKQIVGFLMYDLNELGYEDYGNDNSNFHQKIELECKFLLAYQLTRVVDFLHSISFIHCDINKPSIFINPKLNRLALIDFDSGYNGDKQQKGLTFGKISHWLPMKLAKRFLPNQNNSQELNRVTIEDEFFLLANAVFQLVIDVTPYFFLIDNEYITKKKYIKKNNWPHIDFESDFYNKNNQKQHESFLFFFKSLAENGFEELTSALTTTFNEGYLNDKKRLNANQFKEILAKCNTNLENLPRVNAFESNKILIKHKGESVKFKFEISNFDRVYLGNQLLSINKFESIISLNDTTDVILKVENDFGIVEKKILVSAQRIEPTISFLKSSKSIRDTIEPLKLEWETKNTSRIEISNIIGELPIIGDKEITPIEKTIYILSAYGNFDQVVTKQVEVDVIKPIIKLFDWKINLDKGIDNVDLSWETEDAIKVSISPRIGEQESNGIYHIGIAEKTVFVLIAKGIFAEVKQDLEAAPFPIPMIEKLLIPEPVFESQIDVSITIADIVTRTPILSTVEIDSEVFNPNNIEFIIQKLPEIESPKFLDADFEIIQRSKPRSFNKLISKLKFN